MKQKHLCDSVHYTTFEVINYFSKLFLLQAISWSATTCMVSYSKCAALQQHSSTPMWVYHNEWRCRFRLSMDLTSVTNLSASNIGNRFNNAVSEGSANHDLIGMALSIKRRNTVKNFLCSLTPHLYFSAPIPSQICPLLNNPPPPTLLLPSFYQSPL